MPSLAFPVDKVNQQVLAKNNVGIMCEPNLHKPSERRPPEWAICQVSAVAATSLAPSTAHLRPGGRRAPASQTVLEARTQDSRSVRNRAKLPIMNMSAVSGNVGTPGRTPPPSVLRVRSQGLSPNTYNNLPPTHGSF